MASQAEKLFSTGKPVRIPKALRDGLEEAIQAHLTAVEKLTAVLDKADGEPDLEPSLGTVTYGAPVALTDCEGGDVNDEGEHTWTETHGSGGSGGSTPDDTEPSLAHTLDINQERARKNLGYVNSIVHGTWFSRASDLEVEHDGREPDPDSEPSLGSLNCVGSCDSHFDRFDGGRPLGFSQIGWASGTADDCEEQHNGREPEDGV